MPAIPEGPLDRPQTQQVARLLRERILRQVALEVWTRPPQAIFTGDRDDGRHGQAALDLVRQLKSLHPLLTLTPYDIDTNDRAAKERGISHSPTVVMRCGGRSLRTVGLFFGPFFQSFMDALGVISMGESPFEPRVKQRLRSIEDEVTIEAFLSPFDPISVQAIVLLASFAVEGKHFRVTLYEASQFPTLAQQRMVTQVPLFVINGQRFTGHYNEVQLLEQVERILAGNDEPVVRDRVLASPYINEDDARRMAVERGQGQQPAGGAPGGLIVPGRD